MNVTEQTTTPEHLELILRFESDMVAKNPMAPNTKFNRSKARKELEGIGRPLLPQMLEHLREKHSGKTIQTMETDLFIGWTKLIPAITGQCAYIGIPYIDQNMDGWIRLCEQELEDG